MATKRKAKEAFGRSKADTEKAHAPQLSAFAAATSAISSATADAEAPEASHAEHSLSEHLTKRNRSAPRDNDVGTALPGLAPSLDTAANVDVEVRVEAARLDIPLSTFRGKVSVLRDDEHCLELSLRADEIVTLVGEYDLQVAKGVVTIYGSVLHPERGPQRVYAPAITPLPPITARKPNTVVQILSVTQGLSSIDKLSPLFRNIGANDEKYRSFSLLRTTGHDPLSRAIVPLEIEADMRKAISQINARLDAGADSLRIMATGGKSSGKSTFNRVLCNVITSRVDTARCFYLDLDPGQPEFGPPGQVSLVEVAAPMLGPSFTHLASARNKKYRLVRSHTIAATSFKDDPDHYVSCAIDLISYTPKSVPVIINSCGWTTGLGASTIVSTASKLSITDHIVFEPLDTDLTLELAALTGSSPLRISRRQRQQALRSPAELRALQTMAYFHKKALDDSKRWVSKAISEMRHWDVSYGRENPGIYAIVNYGQGPHEDFLREVLDGMLVAMVVTDDALIEEEAIRRTDVEDLPYLPPASTGHTPPLDPRRSHCIGMALVRGIDVEMKALHLVTPLPESDISAILERKVVLVRGGFDPPEWAYLEDFYATDGAIDDCVERPWINLQEPKGIEGSIWRLRHPPMAKDIR